MCFFNFMLSDLTEQKPHGKKEDIMSRRSILCPLGLQSARLEDLAMSTLKFVRNRLAEAKSFEMWICRMCRM